MKSDARPLIVHVVYRFDTGGLENGVVNLINRLPESLFRHAVVAVSEVTDFKYRVQREDVQFIAMNKPPGHGFRVFQRMLQEIHRLRPAVVHTRNLAALEMSLPAAWARVPVRIHGEHGWGIDDPDGRSRKFRLVRRAYRPFVHHYVALSRQLESYLLDRVGVSAERIAQIYNGVDEQRFRPAAGQRTPIAGSPFADAGLWLVGSVGRLSPVKNQLLLARAFVRALELMPQARATMRLALIGDGPLRTQLVRLLQENRVEDLVWLAGDRSDVPDVMRGLDSFVLPSMGEGISNAILEAMATGLPIVATAVGGNTELLDDGNTGRLVPADGVDAMAQALLDDFRNPESARSHGRRARLEVERRFCLSRMVEGYGDLYCRLLKRASARDELANPVSQE